MRALVEPYGQNLRHLKSNATNGATSRPTFQFSTTLGLRPKAVAQGRDGSPILTAPHN